MKIEYLNTMQLELTEKTYEKLLRLAFLGSWMVEAHHVKDENYFFDLEQKIYAMAELSSKKSYIEYDDQLNRYFPSPEFDEDSVVSSIIDEYDEDCFWDELIDRMTKRDMLDTYGEEAIQKMDLKERIEKENKIIARYEKEFEENGLKNLHFRVQS